MVYSLVHHSSQDLLGVHSLQDHLSYLEVLPSQVPLAHLVVLVFLVFRKDQLDQGLQLDPKIKNKKMFYA